ncbi:MAG TPA: enoyl-CoA hydratase-related protein, partial [Burkholderiales bacterium]
MNYKTIEIQMGQGVAVLWLNRPEVRNAFNEAVIAELNAALGELEADPAVRAVVLAGRGKVFCAGADLNWM